MKGLTFAEARLYFKAPGNLRLTRDDHLYYRSRRRFSFVVRIPAEFRRIAMLCGDLLSFTGGHEFEGGILWLRRWDVGMKRVVRVGWKTLEDIRRAHGDSQSLELAPAQVFRSDESVDFHSFLLYTMAFEWSAQAVSWNAGYFLDIRGSRRFFCVTDTRADCESLMEHLNDWDPKRENEAAGLVRQDR